MEPARRTDLHLAEEWVQQQEARHQAQATAFAERQGECHGRRHQARWPPCQWLQLNLQPNHHQLDVTLLETWGRVDACRPRIFRRWFEGLWCV